MRLETETFFNHLVAEDASILDLFRADYTFVNERLATHYGFPPVAGSYLRKVDYPDDRRVGLLGHGSVLVLTSLANRTSPVLRGKWVMEVLLGRGRAGGGGGGGRGGGGAGGGGGRRGGARGGRGGGAGR
ncbi:MAG: DUF1592 domain-containing protein, partial [Gemmatimonadetes bacterium]|nr:DUF1592 domain-containing protein [Gemmatimonadota bacterium]